MATTENAERLTVVEVWPHGEVKRKLFTGTREECYDAMRYLVEKKRWPMKRLDLIYTESGRFSSFRIEYWRD